MKMLQEANFPNHWKISSICWISRRTPTQQGVPMISSTSLRSFPKTCGLFDTGIAGDDQQITSIVPIAPADVLSEFDLGGHDYLIDPSPFDSNNVGGSFIKDSQVQSNTTLDTDNWDLLDDLSADPLGDDSLDAFINLDKYLMGNSFFDEDGNLVKDTEEVNPVISIPTIEELEQNVTESMPEPVSIMVPDTVELVACSSVDVLAPMELPGTDEQPPRKRKRKAKPGCVKTSMFEIPDCTADNQLDLDHDYSSKRLKLSVGTGSVTNSNNSGDDKQVSVIDSVKDCEIDPFTSFEPPLDKQSLRRLKNNVASKRSREQRKQKFVDMDKEAEELVIKNDQLRKKIVELEKLAAEMKTALVAKMAGK